MAPSTKTNTRKERRARSRSPATRPQRIRIREELPTRETRRSSTLTLRDHRTAIDCPLPSCNAATVHQHCNNLQFFNPHPANEIRLRGYASSHRLASSQFNVGNGGPAMQGHDMFGPEISDDEEAAQAQDENKQRSVVGYDETDDQEEPQERRTLIVTLRVAAPEGGDDALRFMAPADLSKEQQAVVTLDGVAPEEYTVMNDDDEPAPGEEIDNQSLVALANHAKEQQDVVILGETAPEEYTTMDDGTSDLTPGDPITSRRTFDLVEDLSTPLQTISLDADAWDFKAQTQPEESPWTTSPKLQNVFDEWLVPRTPKQTSKSLRLGIERLGDPLHNLSREDGDRELPSTMMHPAPDPYIRQFQVSTEGEDDFEAIFGHSSLLSEMK